MYTFRKYLRRRNTRYKNPQLVAQHCFVASFGRCFPFFTLSDQLDPQQKHLLRVEEMQRADWLIGSGTSKFVARQVVSLRKNEKQNQNLLLKVDPALLFATTFFNPQQMFLLRVKLITQGEKRETSTKTCNETMLRDKLRVFVSRISPPLHELKSKFQRSDRSFRRFFLIST